MKRLMLVLLLLVTAGLLSVVNAGAQKAPEDSITKAIERNMHTVQLAVEDYAYRHGGIYPTSIKDILSLLPKKFANPCNSKLPAVVDGESNTPGQAMYISGGPNNYTVLGNDENCKRMVLRLTGAPVNQTVVQKPSREVAKITFSEADSLQGKYMKKVLIKAKWGDKPGEFKLEPINETHEWKTFIVFDKGGNIYIADRNNFRVNIFDVNGRFIKDIKLSDDDIKEKDKLPDNEKGTLIDDIGVDSKGHIYVGLAALGDNLTVLKLDKKGKNVDKYFFPKAWVGGFDLIEDKDNNIYLAGGWILLDGTPPYGWQVVQTAVPLSFGKLSNTKNANYVTSKIKGIGLQPTTLSAQKVFKNGRMATVDRSGGIVFKNEKGKIVFMKRQYDIVDNHSFNYKHYDNIMATARAAFDDDGNFYIVQGTAQGLQVLKCTPQFEELK